MDGIYIIRFRGAADWGLGMLLLQAGKITGADAGGVIYDGVYGDAGEYLQVNLAMAVPPGATLVQGTPPQPTAYTIPVCAKIPKSAIHSGQPVLLQLPPGPVNVIFQKLRDI